jgi:hypothetical protein
MATKYLWRSWRNYRVQNCGIGSIVHLSGYNLPGTTMIDGACVWAVAADRSAHTSPDSHSPRRRITAIIARFEDKVYSDGHLL